jgi:hypothetical protein
MTQRKQQVIWILGCIAALVLAGCGAPPAVQKEQPVHVVPIEGTELNRVEITEKAAQRIAVQTAPVREEELVRKRTFGGQVVETGGSALIRVALHESDLSRVDRNQPAVVRSLEEGAAGWMGRVVEAPDPQEANSALYCSIDTDQTAFVPEQRVFVEVLTVNGGVTPKIVPYDAVLYDLNGETWVFTNPDPLVYVRAPIAVDYIEGDIAVLSAGPPAGTMVVTHGASQLYGAEAGIGGGGH